MCCSFAVWCSWLKGAWIGFSANRKLQKPPVDIERRRMRNALNVLIILRNLQVSQVRIPVWELKSAPARGSRRIDFAFSVTSPDLWYLSGDHNFFLKVIRFITQHDILGKHGVLEADFGYISTLTTCIYSLSLSQPQFPHLYSGNSSTDLVW